MRRFRRGRRRPWMLGATVGTQIALRTLSSSVRPHLALQNVDLFEKKPCLCWMQAQLRQRVHSAK